MKFIKNLAKFSFVFIALVLAFGVINSKEVSAENIIYKEVTSDNIAETDFSVSDTVFEVKGKFVEAIVINKLGTNSSLTFNGVETTSISLLSDAVITGNNTIIGTGITGTGNLVFINGSLNISGSSSYAVQVNSTKASITFNNMEVKLEKGIDVSNVDKTSASLYIVKSNLDLGGGNLNISAADGTSCFKLESSYLKCSNIFVGGHSANYSDSIANFTIADSYLTCEENSLGSTIAVWGQKEITASITDSEIHTYSRGWHQSEDANDNSITFQSGGKSKINIERTNMHLYGARSIINARKYGNSSEYNLDFSVSDSLIWVVTKSSHAEETLPIWGEGAKINDSILLFTKNVYKNGYEPSIKSVVYGNPEIYGNYNVVTQCNWDTNINISDGQTVTLTKDASISIYEGAAKVNFVLSDNAKLILEEGATLDNIGAVSAEKGYVLFAKTEGGKTTYTAENEIEISNVEELKYFAALVEAGNDFKGVKVKLTSNIDLNNEEWKPIGDSTNKFQGTFDGNGYTISNLKITGYKSNVGLFGYTINGEIKNLTVHNASVSGRLNVGVVSGNPYTSKYTKIKVTGHVEVNGMAYVGGVGGKNAYANWTDITVDVDDSSYVKANSIEDGVAYRTYVGGVIGFMGEGGHSFTNVVSNIDVYGSTCDIGGITGIAHYGNSFINCISSGNIYVTNAVDPVDYAEVGGIAGVWHNGGSPVTIENCIFMGKIYKEESDGTKSILKDSCITGVAYSSTGTGELVAKDNQIISIEVNEKINLYVNDEDKIYFDLPANPTKEGYTFEAWYDDENFTNKITSSIEVVDNFKATNYTIKWIPIEYTIEFDSNGGSAVESITYTIEDTKDLGEPTKTGYNFVGWHENDKLVENIKVGTYGNKSLVAKWEATEYIISFDSNGGSAVESIVYTIEEELSITANPTLKHYTFTGWYNENNELVENIKVGTYGNKILVAKWQAVEYTITFESNGGNLVESIKYTVESDNVVLPATTSSYANHNFLGWYDVKGYEVTTINASTGKDVTVYAKWSHTFGEWKKIQESTTDEPGKEMRVCECGANEIKRTPVKTFNDIFGDFFDKLVNLINSFFEKLNNIINSLQNNPNDEETKEQATEDLYGLYFGDKE
ncbi:MAG: InlB B-repeat-containing protein [Bacilli bacterium]|nr:InlB B-repeat-containing protein [Bacilli bacterium]